MSGRRRLISFRLSDSEYEQLRNLCNSSGGGTLSDFVRSVLIAMLNGRDEWDKEVDSFLRELNQRSSDLQSLASRLNLLLRHAQFAQKRYSQPCPNPAAAAAGPRQSSSIQA